MPIFWGTQHCDERERNEMADAPKSRSPVRDYGHGGELPMKAAARAK